MPCQGRARWCRHGGLDLLTGQGVDRYFLHEATVPTIAVAAEGRRLLSALGQVWQSWAGLCSTCHILPEGFVYEDGVPQRGDFAEAVYISMVTLSTVGFGEIVAAHPLLRLATAFQAVTGFGLLTASVTLILQAHPALRRRRASMKPIISTKSSRRVPCRPRLPMPSSWRLRQTQ
jgi:hypothetical protein